MLAPQLVERVLTRLGFDAEPRADRQGLEALYLAWCHRVPFDNVRKRLALVRGDGAPLPGMEPDDFFESWLTHGTGGTCWPAAGALYALCTSLGFRAERAIATMVTAVNTRPTHGTVIVALGGESYMLDVAMLSEVPIPMLPGDEPLAQHPAAAVQRVHLQDGRFGVYWRPFHSTSGTLLCRIEGQGIGAEEFAAAYERSRAWSPFNFAISARLNRADRAFGLGMGRPATLTDEGLQATDLLSPDARTRMLVDELGISEELASQLPPDEALPPHPGR